MLTNGDTGLIQSGNGLAPIENEVFLSGAFKRP